MLELNGAVALVTGGASGLGEASARALAAKGAKVVVMDLERQKERGEALASELGGAFAACDVTKTDDIIAATELGKEMGAIKALVNCAGIGWATRTIGRDGQYSSAHDLEIFRTVINVNLIGTFDCIRIVATAMSQNEPNESGERGAIVNTASVAAYDGQIGQASYSASKGGVVGMTLPVARDLSATGIRVNTIAPGLFDTPIYGGNQEFMDKLLPNVLFPKRFGLAEEFGSLAVEMITNSYMNAVDMRLDAGARMLPK